MTLKKNKTLASLDLAGTTISPGGGQALADALLENHTITNLELDGGEERFSDEFSIPVGHRDEPWMQALDFQLRLNRAHPGSLKNPKLFVEALNSVSDHWDAFITLFADTPDIARTFPCRGLINQSVVAEILKSALVITILLGPWRDEASTRGRLSVALGTVPEGNDSNLYMDQLLWLSHYIPYYKIHAILYNIRDYMEPRNKRETR